MEGLIYILVMYAEIYALIFVIRNDNLVSTVGKVRESMMRNHR